MCDNQAIDQEVDGLQYGTISRGTWVTWYVVVDFLYLCRRVAPRWCYWYK